MQSFAIWMDVPHLRNGPKLLDFVHQTDLSYTYRKGDTSHEYIGGFKLGISVEIAIHIC